MDSNCLNSESITCLEHIESKNSYLIAPDYSVDPSGSIDLIRELALISSAKKTVPIRRNQVIKEIPNQSRDNRGVSNPTPWAA
jgi:hypothetical protein